MAALELHREYEEPGEAAMIAEMVEIAKGLVQPDPQDGHGLRAQHAKATGCVRATFEIKRDLPAHLRHGVFAEAGRSFDAVVRFSNAPGSKGDDRTGTVHGMAIKLLNVDGPRAIAGDDDRSQDFLFADQERFFVANQREYLKAMRLNAASGVLGRLKPLGEFVLSNPLAFARLLSMLRTVIDNPLTVEYRSLVPFWLGEAAGPKPAGQAVKYLVKPGAPPKGTTQPKNERGPDYLTQAIKNYLGRQEAIFDFLVHVQADATTMPIEDATKMWDEVRHPPVSVATLRVLKLEMQSLGQIEREYEARSFTPWHALQQHRPMGGLNRMRKKAYEASTLRRNSLKANGPASE